jgi:hypothetical protein
MSSTCRPPAFAATVGQPVVALIAAPRFAPHATSACREAYTAPAASIVLVRGDDYIVCQIDQKIIRAS